MNEADIMKIADLNYVVLFNFFSRFSVFFFHVLFVFVLFFFPMERGNIGVLHLK
jgi:hypothetical protein